MPPPEPVVGPLLLRDALLVDGRRVDVALRDGAVAAVRPHDPRDGEPAGSVLDLQGALLLPAPAEPHAHLDKALTWEAAGAGYGDLPAAVAAWSRHSATRTVADVQARARRALAELLASGATAVRTHANAGSGADPLLALHALVALREQLRGPVELQVVFLSRPDLPDAVLLAALDAGADMLGGAPHLAPDPGAEQARLLRLAAAAGVGLDLHTDEQLDPEVLTLPALAAAVTAARFPHAVTASHCVSLGLQQGGRLTEAVAAVRRAGIGVVALPLTNLFLQGRGATTSPPRGLTALRPLLAAGVPLAAGADNLRDPFLPVGRADPLEVASLLVTAGHLTVEEAWHAVSTGARQVMGLPAAGPQPGLRADLLAVRAGSLAEAVAAAPAERTVLAGGQVVARTTVSRRTALDG